MQIDPVCGMQVEQEKASGRSEYSGKAYYFCSQACKEQFEKEPLKFTRPAQP